MAALPPSWPRSLRLETGRFTSVLAIHYAMARGVYRVTYLDPSTFRPRGCLAAYDAREHRLEVVTSEAMRNGRRGDPLPADASLSTKE